MNSPNPLLGAPAVSVYRQACSGIPLAVRFVGRDRRLWMSMVQGTQRFRQVRAASCVIPYVLCGCPCPPLYIRGDRVTWKVLAKYSWNPTTTQLGSFLCIAASSTPIRVVTREVRYIHELFLTLEHSMPISSPAAPGLTHTPSDKPDTECHLRTGGPARKPLVSEAIMTLWTGGHVVCTCSVPSS